MLRKLYIVPVLALLALPALASAQFEAGNWALELSGQGANDKDFTTYTASINFDLGYFVTKEIGIISSDGGSSWSGSTAAAFDYHFDLDRWQPYVGANIGYAYGSDIEDAWAAGPEVGVKYFVNSTTFIDVRAAYEFDLNNGFDSGAFQYGLGIGFKW